MTNFKANGSKEFIGGKNAWIEVANIAKTCPHFKLDEEEELVSDEPISCYNCRYRRWSLTSFSCLKQS